MSEADTTISDALIWSSAGTPDWAQKFVEPPWAVDGSDGSARLEQPGAQADWHSLSLPACVQQLIVSGAELRVTFLVGGAAIAAGLQLGCRRFVVPLDRRAWPQRVSLEIGDSGRRTTFTVDGRITEAWPPFSDGAEDLAASVLKLTALGGARVEFSEIRVYKFERPCTISIVLSCHKFAQRLRIAVRSWVKQRAPSGLYEVIVVTPGNPDGVSEQLAATAASFPLVRLRHLALNGPPDKGWLLNEAARLSSGRIIWFTDADCVHAASAVGMVSANMQDILATGSIFFAERRHLGRTMTERVLCGELDLFAEFERQYPQANDREAQRYPWGYSQIMAASIARAIPFREDLKYFAHSDGVFLDDARRAGHAFCELVGLRCLHLAHPFSWYGSDHFL